MSQNPARPNPLIIRPGTDKASNGPPKYDGPSTYSGPAISGARTPSANRTSVHHQSAMGSSDYTSSSQFPHRSPSPGNSYSHLHHMDNSETASNSSYDGPLQLPIASPYQHGASLTHSRSGGPSDVHRTMYPDLTLQREDSTSSMDSTFCTDVLGDQQLQLPQHPISRPVIHFPPPPRGSGNTGGGGGVPVQHNVSQYSTSSMPDRSSQQYGRGSSKPIEALSPGTQFSVLSQAPLEPSQSDDDTKSVGTLASPYNPSRLYHLDEEDPLDISDSQELTPTLMPHMRPPPLGMTQLEHPRPYTGTNRVGVTHGSGSGGTGIGDESELDSDPVLISNIANTPNNHILNDDEISLSSSLSNQCTNLEQFNQFQKQISHALLNDSQFKALLSAAPERRSSLSISSTISGDIPRYRASTSGTSGGTTVSHTGEESPHSRSVSKNAFSDYDLDGRSSTSQIVLPESPTQEPTPSDFRIMTCDMPFRASAKPAPAVLNKPKAPSSSTKPNYFTQPANSPNVTPTANNTSSSSSRHRTSQQHGNISSSSSSSVSVIPTTPVLRLPKDTSDVPLVSSSSHLGRPQEHHVFVVPTIDFAMNKSRPLQPTVLALNVSESLSSTTSVAASPNTPMSSASMVSSPVDKSTTAQSSTASPVPKNQPTTSTTPFVIQTMDMPIRSHNRTASAGLTTSPSVVGTHSSNTTIGGGTAAETSGFTIPTIDLPLNYKKTGTTLSSSMSSSSGIGASSTASVQSKTTVNPAQAQFQIHTIDMPFKRTPTAPPPQTPEPSVSQQPATPPEPRVVLETIWDRPTHREYLGIPNADAYAAYQSVHDYFNGSVVDRIPTFDTSLTSDVHHVVTQVRAGYRVCSIMSSYGSSLVRQFTAFSQAFAAPTECESFRTMLAEYEYQQVRRDASRARVEDDDLSAPRLLNSWSARFDPKSSIWQDCRTASQQTPYTNIDRAFEFVAALQKIQNTNTIWSQAVEVLTTRIKRVFISPLSELLTTYENNIKTIDNLTRALDKVSESVCAARLRVARYAQRLSADWKKLCTQEKEIRIACQVQYFYNSTGATDSKDDNAYYRNPLSLVNETNNIPQTVIPSRPTLPIVVPDATTIAGPTPAHTTRNLASQRKAADNARYAQAFTDPEDGAIKAYFLNEYQSLKSKQIKKRIALLDKNIRTQVDVTSVSYDKYIHATDLFKTSNAQLHTTSSTLLRLLDKLERQRLSTLKTIIGQYYLAQNEFLARVMQDPSSLSSRFSFSNSCVSSGGAGRLSTISSHTAPTSPRGGSITEELTQLSITSNEEHRSFVNGIENNTIAFSLPHDLSYHPGFTLLNDLYILVRSLDVDDMMSCLIDDILDYHSYDEVVVLPPCTRQALTNEIWKEYTHRTCDVQLVNTFNQEINVIPQLYKVDTLYTEVPPINMNLHNNTIYGDTTHYGQFTVPAGSLVVLLPDNTFRTPVTLSDPEQNVQANKRSNNFVSRAANALNLTRSTDFANTSAADDDLDGINRNTFTASYDASSNPTHNNTDSQSSNVLYNKPATIHYNDDEYVFVELITAPGFHQSAFLPHHNNNNNTVQQSSSTLSSNPTSNNNTTGANNNNMTTTLNNNNNVSSVLSPNSPSRGFIPLSRLQPVPLDDISSLHLAYVLFDQKMRMHFRQSLKTKFASENYDFWVRARQFRTTPWILHQTDHWSASATNLSSIWDENRNVFHNRGLLSKRRERSLSRSGSRTPVVEPLSSPHIPDMEQHGQVPPPAPVPTIILPQNNRSGFAIPNTPSAAANGPALHRSVSNHSARSEVSVASRAQSVSGAPAAHQNGAANNDASTRVGLSAADPTHSLPFSAKFNRELFLERAFAMYYHFIASGSARQINLSSEVFQALHRTFMEQERAIREGSDELYIHINIFLEAEHEIYRLLSNDSWSTYKMANNSFIEGFIRIHQHNLQTPPQLITPSQLIVSSDTSIERNNKRANNNNGDRHSIAHSTSRSSVSISTQRPSMSMRSPPEPPISPRGGSTFSNDGRSSFSTSSLPNSSTH